MEIEWKHLDKEGATCVRCPEMDYVITVCDNAAGELCPLWPGKPVTTHWGVPDPAAVDGDSSTREDAFRTNTQGNSGRQGSTRSAAQTFRDERNDQGVQAHPLLLGLGRKLGVKAFRNPLDPFSA